jgi:hypothetical protein
LHSENDFANDFSSLLLQSPSSTSLNEHFLGGFRPVASTPATTDVGFSGFGHAVNKPSTESEEEVEFAIPHKPVFSGFGHNNGEIGASLLGDGYIVPSGTPQSTPAYSSVGHSSGDTQASLLHSSAPAKEPVFSAPGSPVFSGFGHATESAPASLLNSSPPTPSFSGFGRANSPPSSYLGSL